jgi:hypothetical protein
MSTIVFDSPDPFHVAGKAKQLYDVGVRGVILYLSPINPSGSKTVRKEQIAALHAAGIAVGFVCEGWGGSDNFAHHDISAATGTRDGAFCGHYMQTLGAPASVVVSPTVDNDTSPIQLKSLCLPYFAAFRLALPASYRLGAYGCGALLFALEATKLVDVPWLSNAMGWSRSHEYAATQRAVITQQKQTKLLSIDIDPDVVKGDDLAAAGFWLPPSAKVTS